MLTEMDLLRLNKLADYLDEVRREKKLEVADLEALGVTTRSWWYYFVNARRFRGYPRPRTIAMIADGMGIPVSKINAILEENGGISVSYAGVADEAVMELVEIVESLPSALRNAVVRVARELRDAQRS